LHGAAAHFSVSSTGEVMIMTLSAVSPDVVALLLGMDEPSVQEIDRVVAEALAAAGCVPWRAMEAELYGRGAQRLLIARPAPPGAAGWSPPSPGCVAAARNRAFLFPPDVVN